MKRKNTDDVGTESSPPSKIRRIDVEWNKDVITTIATFCDIVDVLNMSYVNKMFREAVDVDVIWEPLFDSKFACRPNEAELAKIDQVSYSSNSVFKKYFAFKNSYFKCQFVKYESLFEEFSQMFDGEDGDFELNDKYKPAIEWDQIKASLDIPLQEIREEFVDEHMHKETFANEFTGERFVMLRYENGGNEFGTIHPEGQVNEVAQIYDGTVLPYNCEAAKKDMLSAMEAMYNKIREIYYERREREDQEEEDAGSQ